MFTNTSRQQRVANVRHVEVDRWVHTTCGYCSTGCGIEVGVKDRRAVTVRGAAGHPVNDGKLCLKGIWEFETIHAPDRGTHPLLRETRDQPFRRASWDHTLDRVAAEFRRIQSTYGRDALAVVSTGQIYTEEFYTLGKLVRGGLGTNHYDGNTTLCMASAVSGYKRSFGSDGPPGCYDDFEQTECLIAFGSNLVECHPVLYWRLRSALERRSFPVIVVDPRVTTFAQQASASGGLHLPITPGTDVVFLNALAHVILAEGLEDSEYLARHVTGIDEFRRCVARFTPEYAEPITGIPAPTIRRVARLFARARAAMAIWTMGINQSTHGSNGVVAINNLSLLTGNVGRPGGSPLSITGQCNAMGTREFSSCSGLPGYRSLENPQHRAEIARIWGVDEAIFPKSRGRAMTDIFPAIETGEVKGLWIIATNPMTSMPNTHRIARTLEKLEFLAVQDVFFPGETAEYAHVFLPAAMWAEKTGTFTNTERRVNLVRKAVDPPGEARSDLEIFCALADRLGLGALLAARAPEAVFEEIRLVSRGRPCDYSGMDYAGLEAEGGIQWPAPMGVRNEAFISPPSIALPPSPPAGRAGRGEEQGGGGRSKGVRGTARLYTDGGFHTEDGKARLITVEFEDNNERPDEEYPFWFNTGRVVEHWHTRTKTGRIGNLNKFSPIPYVEMNPRDAMRHGIAQMEEIRLVSRRGAMGALAQITERTAPGTVFVPFHFARGANFVTLGLLDPHSRQPAYKQCAVRVEKVKS
jgi:assimilatory nitrate reductase catalytic subunit